MRVARRSSRIEYLSVCVLTSEFGTGIQEGANPVLTSVAVSAGLNLPQKHRFESADAGGRRCVSVSVGESGTCVPLSRLVGAAEAICLANGVVRPCVAGGLGHAPGRRSEI